MKHKRMKRGMIVALAAVTTTLILAGCFSNTSERSGSADGNLEVVMSVAPTSLDPTGAFNTADTLGSSNMYVTLVRLATMEAGNGELRENPNEVEGYLAESWEVSDDGLTYTFHLKKGLEFESGTPVDSEAVKFSFERALESTAAVFVNSLTPELFRSIETPDADTVVFHLTQPRANALQAWASPPASIVDPTVVSGNEPEWLASNEAGSGPYRMVSYTPNHELVLEERPGFAEWAGWAPRSPSATITFVKDDSTLLLEAKQGADVVIGLTYQSADSLLNDDALRVVSFSSVISDFMNLSWSKPPFDNEKVREAITYAIDWDALIEGPLAGYGEKYYGPINPNLPNFNVQLSTPVETDLERARQALDESGQMLPIQFELMIDQGSPLDQQLAQVLQSTLEPVGFDVEIVVLPTAQFTEATYGDGFQAQLRQDAPAVGDAGFYLGYAMACEVEGVGSNASQMCIPEADELLVAARAASNPTDAQPLYDEITKLWRAAYPQIPLAALSKVVVLKDELAEYEYTSDFTNRIYHWG